MQIYELFVRIEHFFHICSPFLRFFAFVESLPGNRFAYFQGAGAVFFPVPLCGKQQHLDVAQSDFFPEIRQVVKEIGILSADVYGHDVPPVLDGFRDEILFPLQIPDNPFDLPAAQPGREHDHLAVGSVSLFDRLDGLFRLLAVLIHGQENRVQVLQIQKNIVYREFQFRIPGTQE